MRLIGVSICCEVALSGFSVLPGCLYVCVLYSNMFYAQDPPNNGCLIITLYIALVHTVSFIPGCAILLEQECCIDFAA